MLVCEVPDIPATDTWEDTLVLHAAKAGNASITASIEPVEEDHDAANNTVAVSAFILADGALLRRLLITGMTVIWGCRLGFHIAIRKRGKGEDFRYAAMRAERPGSFPRRSKL